MSKPSDTLPFYRIAQASLLVTATGAAFSANAEDTVQLDTTTIWAAEINASSLHSLSEDSITTKQPDHMSDLLRDVPGVDVGGTHSLNQRINIRGLNETDLDIRVDGASQHARMFHHIGNLTLNPDIIKSVDIQVGSNSVVSDGLGGAIHFETKNANDLLLGDEKVGARLHAGYGSNSYHQQSVTLYGKPGDTLDAMLYGFRVERDNFEDGDGEKTFGSEGSIKNGLVKFGWEPDAEQRLQLSYDIYQDKGDYNPRPDMSGAANQAFGGDQLIPTEYKRDSLALNYEIDKGDAIFLTASLYRNHLELFRDESVVTGRWPGNRLSQNTAENTNTGALVTAQSLLVTGDIDHQLTYGLDVNKQTSENQYGTTYSAKETLTKKALFIEDRIQLTPEFSVTPGVRFSDAERKALTGNTSYSDTTFALATDYMVTDSLTLFASTRELFKAPDLIESFIAYQDKTVLADGTKEESGLNSEIGARFNTSIDAHNFSGSLTLFRTDIDDHLSEQWNGDGYTISNAGDVRFQGFELSASHSYDAFTGRLSYSRVKATDKTNGGPVLDSNGRSADLGDSISLNLDYKLAQYDLNLGWGSMFVLEEDNVVDGTEAKKSYDIHSVYAQWAPESANGLVMTFGIDNLFDELYVAHASRSGVVRGLSTEDPEPGRNIKLSLSYHF